MEGDAPTAACPPLFLFDAFLICLANLTYIPGSVIDTPSAYPSLIVTTHPSFCLAALTGRFFLFFLIDWTLVLFLHG
jgi:hypothetical protein